MEASRRSPFDDQRASERRPVSHASLFANSATTNIVINITVWQKRNSNLLLYKIVVIFIRETSPLSVLILGEKIYTFAPFGGLVTFSWTYPPCAFQWIVVSFPVDLCGFRVIISIEGWLCCYRVTRPLDPCVVFDGSRCEKTRLAWKIGSLLWFCIETDQINVPRIDRADGLEVKDPTAMMTRSTSIGQEVWTFKVCPLHFNYCFYAAIILWLFYIFYSYINDTNLCTSSFSFSWNTNSAIFNRQNSCVLGTGQ